MKRNLKAELTDTEAGLAMVCEGESYVASLRQDYLEPSAEGELAPKPTWDILPESISLIFPGGTKISQRKFEMVGLYGDVSRQVSWEIGNDSASFIINIPEGELKAQSLQKLMTLTRFRDGDLQDSGEVGSLTVRFRQGQGMIDLSREIEEPSVLIKVGVEVLRAWITLVAVVVRCYEADVGDAPEAAADAPATDADAPGADAPGADAPKAVDV